MRSRSVPSVLRTLAIFIASLQAARAGAVSAAAAREVGVPLYQRAVQGNAVRPVAAPSRRHMPVSPSSAATVTLTVPTDSLSTHGHATSATIAPTRKVRNGHDNSSPLVELAAPIACHSASAVARHQVVSVETHVASAALPGAARARAPCAQALA
jgi:hypothetical protein